MNKLLAVALLALASFSLPAIAAVKTVTLGVPGMNCELCPITVKKALSKLQGVTQAVVSFEKKEAVVSFDDARTNVDALLKASGRAGYPATVK